MNEEKEKLIAFLMKSRDLIGFSGVSKAAMLRLANNLTHWGVTVQRHGRWIQGYDEQDSWYCSECKHDVMPADDFATPYELGMNFCEHCGAKMDLDDPNVESLVELQDIITARESQPIHNK